MSLPWHIFGLTVTPTSSCWTLSAAVYMFFFLNLSPQQRYLRRLPELLTAVAELLTRHQPDNVPVLHKDYPCRISDSGTSGV